jgi:hypothetical protein
MIMKTRRIYVSLFIILTLTLSFINGCSSKSDSPSSAKAITAFSLNGVAGTINETAKTITVAVPSLTNVYSLAATFTTTGSTVTVGTTTQTSGSTINNFIAPVAYTVTAADGSAVTYTVTVTINRAWHNSASYINPGGTDAWYPQVAMDNNGNAIIVWQQYDGTNYHIFKSEYRGGIWTNPANLTDNISPGGAGAWNPQVAMDNNSNAIIVWQQSNGTNYHIFKSEYRSGVWTNPTGLTDNISPNGQDATYPQVAMDNNGNAIIVWQQSNGTNYHIFKSEYRGGVWTNPANFTDNISPNGQDAAYPQVAMDNNGNAIIVWQQSDGANFQIFKSEYRGGVWTNPASLANKISPSGQDAYTPYVAMDNNGNAIIVWQQNDGVNDQIFKSEYRSGIWTNPANLSDHISPDGTNAWNPQVAMDNNGNAVIAWYQYDGANNQVFKSEYRGGVWTNPANLSDHISPDGGAPSIILTPLGFSTIRVAMDNNGNTIITWFLSELVEILSEPDSQTWESYSFVFKSEYRGGVWHNPAVSDAISGEGASYPQVAMDNNGNAIIVWMQDFYNEGLLSEMIFKSEYR